MDKSPVLDRVHAEGEDRLLLAKVLDRAEQAASRNVPAATDILSPQQQMQVLVANGKCAVSILDSDAETLDDAILADILAEIEAVIAGGEQL